MVGVCIAVAVGVLVGVEVLVKVGVGVRKSPPMFWEAARRKGDMMMNTKIRMRRMVLSFLEISPLNGWFRYDGGRASPSTQPPNCFCYE
jgi:hypothetical protein